MSYTTLRYEKAERIALVTFSTPDNLNGITEARLDELEAVLDDCAADQDIGALILTGEGKAFCVGLDLDLLDKAFADLDYFDVIVARVNGIITRLENLDIPTITAHNGYTRAGGFEIALGCDFMIVADEAKVGDVHSDSGVVPAAVTLRLRRRVGDQRAKEILWTRGRKRSMSASRSNRCRWPIWSTRPRRWPARWSTSRARRLPRSSG
jgi:enoyl-CoA hydratase/carnithine racemase